HARGGARSGVPRARAGGRRRVGGAGGGAGEDLELKARVADGGAAPPLDRLRGARADARGPPRLHDGAVGHLYEVHADGHRLRAGDRVGEALPALAGEADGAALELGADAAAAARAPAVRTAPRAPRRAPRPPAAR